jgi:predicted O-methyltransferase YrrM
MQRNSHRLIYGGVKGWTTTTLLRIFSKVREQVPDAQLSICLSAQVPEFTKDDPQLLYAYSQMIRDGDELLKHPGVTQMDSLTEEDFRSAAVWCYPTHQPEGECDFAKLAQCFGCIPVVNPIGAVANEVFAGFQIFGIPVIDRMVTARYVYQLIRMCNEQQMQEDLRGQMMERANAKWDPREVLARHRAVMQASNIHGWMQLQELTWLAREASQSDSVIEIGSWRGRSTFAMAACCQGPVRAVDTWKGGRDEPEHIRKTASENDLYAEFRANVPRNVIPIRAESALASQDAPSADMIFIDAGHSEEEVRADIRAWRGKATRLLCGHDYDWPSVRAAVHAELGEVKQGPGAIWYCMVNQKESLSNAAD